MTSHGYLARADNNLGYVEKKMSATAESSIFFSTVTWTFIKT